MEYEPCFLRRITFWFHCPADDRNRLNRYEQRNHCWASGSTMAAIRKQTKLKLGMMASLAFMAFFAWTFARDYWSLTKLRENGVPGAMKVISLVHEWHSRRGSHIWTYDVQLDGYRFWFDSKLECSITTIYPVLYDQEAYNLYRRGAASDFSALVIGTRTESVISLIGHREGPRMVPLLVLGFAVFGWQVWSLAKQLRRESLRLQHATEPKAREGMRRVGPATARTARTSVMKANIESSELGEYDASEALAAFDSYPWADEVRHAERLAAKDISSVSPDMTFSIRPYHFTITVRDAQPTLDVELCVPNRRKFLGWITIKTTKFFEFKKVSREELQALLNAFFGVPIDRQFSFFSSYRRLDS